MKKYYIIFLFLPVLCYSQMTTDRPGEGISSEFVDPKTLQLESGINYFGGDRSFTSDHLLRFGLTKRWEVRLETSQDFSDSSESTYGFSSKFNIFESKNSSPSLTLIAGSDFKFEEYFAVLSSDLSLSEKLSASANLGYQKIAK